MADETALDEHLAALNAYDLERVILTYVTRPVLVVNGHRLEGRADVQAFYASMGFASTTGRSFSHLHVEEQRRYAMHQSIAIEQTLTGVHTGAWRGIPPSSRRFEIPVCSVYSLASTGLIESEFISFDGASLLEQLTRSSEESLIAGRYRVGPFPRFHSNNVRGARDLLLNREVAIELWNFTEDRAHAARVVEQKKLATRLNSEHVVHVLDAGFFDNETAYVVIEWLEGRDLHSWVHQRGPLAVDLATDFVLQACDAIAEAHSMGIVHRDLKPANLFVVEGRDRSCVKVLGFGLASGPDGAGLGSRDAQVNVLVGSPLYMSPEQMRPDHSVDGRSDLWSLGVSLYELTSGHPPFEPSSLSKLRSQILWDGPRRLPPCSPPLPEGFRAVVLKCMQADRRNRYQSVLEFADDLLPFAPERERPLVEQIRSRGAPIGGAACVDEG